MSLFTSEGSDFYLPYISYQYLAIRDCLPDTEDKQCDTAGQGNDENKHTTQSSKSADESNTRRSRVQSRSALFNGSRNSSSTGRGDDGGDDEDERARLPLPKQCETSSESDSTSNLTLNLATGPSCVDMIAVTNSDCLSNIGEDHLRNTQPTSSRDNQHEPAAANPDESLMLINSTALNQSYSISDMSVLQGISRIWEAAKNVSLFGTSYSRQHRKKLQFELTINEEDVLGRKDAGADQSESDNSLELESDLDEIPNISGISCDAADDDTAIEANQTNVSFSEINEKHDSRCLAQNQIACLTITGIANPEITPISMKLKALGTPMSSRSQKRRSKSECSASTKARPYEVPPSVMIRKNLRSQARFNHRDNRVDETPLGRRRSKSESHGSTPSAINCIHARESGLYDCSSGLGDYFHLQHEYMDNSDTGRIDKEQLFKSLEKYLSIPEDHPNNHQYSVNLSWNNEEIAAMSNNNSRKFNAHHIDQRFNLVYLLGRMVHHTTRLTSSCPGFNGLSITVLLDQEKFQIKCPTNHQGPIPILHIGDHVGVDIVPKKQERFRCNIHDVQLENFSLLTIYPETFKHMNISIPGGRKDSDHHVLIIPCIVDEEIDEISQDSRETEDNENQVQPPEQSTENEVEHSMLKHKAASETLMYVPADQMATSSTAKNGEAIAESTDQNVDNLNLPAFQATEKETQNEVLAHQPDPIVEKHEDRAQLPGRSAEKESDQCLTLMKSTETEILGQSEVPAHQAAPSTEHFEAITQQPEQHHPTDVQDEVLAHPHAPTPEDGEEMAQPPEQSAEEGPEYSPTNEGLEINSNTILEDYTNEFAPTVEYDDVIIEQPDQQADRMGNNLTIPVRPATEFRESNNDVPAHSPAQNFEDDEDRLQPAGNVAQHRQKSESGEDNAPAEGLIKQPTSFDKSSVEQSGRVKLFLAKETLTNIVNSNSGEKISDWLRICGLKKARTAELSRKGMLSHLFRVSEGKIKLPPQLIEKLVKKLNDEAVANELLRLNFTPAKNARRRKTVLENYLSAEFSTLNLADYNKTRKQEISQIKSMKKARRKPNKSKKKMQFNGSPAENGVDIAEVDSKSEGINSNTSDTKVTTNLEGDQPKISNSSSLHGADENTHGEDILREKVGSEMPTEIPGLKTASCVTLKEDQVPKSAPESSAAILEMEQKKSNTKKKEDKQKPFENKTNVDHLMQNQFEKPLKTLEGSLLKIQETVSAHGEQLHQLSKNNYPKNADKTLLDSIEQLRKKIDDICHQVEGQQLVISRLIDATSTSHPVQLPNPSLEEVNNSLDDIALEPIGEKETGCPSTTVTGEYNSASNFERFQALLEEEHQLRKSCNSDSCREQSSRLKCLITSLWTMHKELELRTRESCPCTKRASQTRLINSEHSYCEINPRIAKSRKNSLLTAVTTGAESKNTSKEDCIISGDEIEVCENIELSDTEVPENQALYTSSPPKPIPILSKASNIANVVFGGKSDSKDNKMHCMIIHDEEICTNHEKLGELFNIKHLRVDSVRKGMDGIASIQARITELKPAMIFLKLGRVDLEAQKVSEKQLVYLLKRFIKKCKESLNGAVKISVSLLTPDPGNQKPSDQVNSFNQGISKMVGDLHKNYEHGQHIYLEEEEFSVKGIGSKWLSLKDSMTNKKLVLTDDEPEEASGEHKQGDDSNKINPPTKIITSRRTEKHPDVPTSLVENSVDKTYSTFCTKQPKEQPNEKSTSTKDVRNLDSDKDTQHSNDINTERQTNINSAKNRSLKTKYQKHKCLLVHDHFFDEFDASKFTASFDVERYQVKSISRIISEGGLISKINKSKPEIVYIHAGLIDLYKNKATQKTLEDNIKKLVYDILESTQAIVCVSLLIPIPGFPDLNDDIFIVNEEIANFVSRLRKSKRYADRLYSTCTNRLGGFVKRTVGSRGMDLFVDKNGQRILWLILKDSLFRCLKMNGPDADSNGHNSFTQKKSNDG